MALYYPPVKPNAPIYSFQNFEAPNTPISPAQGGSSVTEEWLTTHYLQFPNAQGVENFGFQELNLTSTNIGESANLYINPNAGVDVVLATSQTNGSLSIITPATTLNTMVLSPSTGITFGDLTTQSTAYNDLNAVQNDQTNTFLSPYIQTFQGSNSTTNTTAPLQFSNVSSGEYGSLYVDPSSANDLTIYSNQTNGGLTIRTSSASFTLNPYTITSGIVGARSLNPIDMNGNGLYGLSSLYYNGNATTALMNLSSGTIGFNNNNLSQIGTAFIGDNSGTNYSTISQSGFNLSLVNNTPYSGGGTNNINFNLKNNTNTIVTPITIYPTSILIGTQLDLNTNTLYNANLNSNCVATTQGLGNSTTAIATTAFVQNAIGAIGGGVSLSGDNVWTNFNNFNVNAGAYTTKSYVKGLTPVWNLTPSPTGGAGDCSLIANTSVGATNNSFQIYCVGVDTVSSTIASSTPQLTLSNNGFPMQVKDGINIPSGETYAVNGVNILNNTNLLGSPTLANNPPSYSNNTSIATTQFVQSLLPRFTSSTYILNSTSNCTMSPTSGALITQSVQSTTTASNIITFYNSSFNININTSITNGTLATLAFDIPPWQDYPTSGNPVSFSFYGTNTFNGAGYFFSISFKYSTSPPFLCAITYGNAPTPPVTAGNAYLFNLSDLGSKSIA